MRFITITLIVHAPDPRTGRQKSTQERFQEVIGNARLAEDIGFDGFGVGERPVGDHTAPAPAASSPAGPAGAGDRAAIPPVATTG